MEEEEGRRDGEGSGGEKWDRKRYVGGKIKREYLFFFFKQKTAYEMIW